MDFVALQDLQESGAPLAVILAAGEWKSRVELVGYGFRIALPFALSASGSERVSGYESTRK